MTNNFSTCCKKSTPRRQNTFPDLVQDSDQDITCGLPCKLSSMSSSNTMHAETARPTVNAYYRQIWYNQLSTLSTTVSQETHHWYHISAQIILLTTSRIPTASNLETLSVHEIKYLNAWVNVCQHSEVRESRHGYWIRRRLGSRSISKCASWPCRHWMLAFRNSVVGYV